MKESFKFQKSEIRKERLTAEGQDILCNFGKNNFDHCYHGNDKQINTVIDLIINFSFEQQKQLENLKKQVKSLSKKVEYNKESLKSIESTIFEKNKKEPSSLEQIINKLEKISINKGKDTLEIKPVIWKYF